MCTASWCARAADITPPLERITRSLAPLQRLGQALQVTLHHRAQIGIHHRGAAALVFAKLRQHLMRHRHGNAEPLRRLRDGRLVHRVGIGVQQADGQRLRPGTPHALHNSLDFRRRQGFQHLAVVGQTFGNAEPHAARHQRRQLFHERVIQVRARLAPNLQHVLESPRRHQRRAGALALQQRIGRHGRAVHHLRPDEIGTQVLQPLQHCLRRVVRCRQDFMNYRRAILNADEIAERSTGINANMVNHLC